MKTKLKFTELAAERRMLWEEQWEALSGFLLMLDNSKQGLEKSASSGLHDVEKQGQFGDGIILPFIKEAGEFKLGEELLLEKRVRCSLSC